MAFPVYSSESSRSTNQGVLLTEDDLNDILSTYIADESRAENAREQYTEQDEMDDLYRVFVPAAGSDEVGNDTVETVETVEAVETLDGPEEQDMTRLDAILANLQQGSGSYSSSLIDFSEDEEDEEYGGGVVRSTVSVLYHLAQVMDMRSEQMYERSISKADNTAKIIWITFRDQAISPCFQGFGMKLLKVVFIPWLRATNSNGSSAGIALRDLLRRMTRAVFYPATSMRR
ncbi:uncharacterized protein V1516DRAFT_100070 [Lipomyces oligophaga]|uniref:uncharacterized protein n=1 Tax=Lipomyces oligophaga TaxID=45792 RepID=UPI0034CFDBD2